MAKSSLMQNFRHVKVRVHGVTRQLSEEEAKSELKKAMLAYFGVEGYSLVLPRLERYDAKSKEMVVRVLRGSEKRFLSACALTAEFAGTQARLECLGISGTIRALLENE